MSEARGVPLPTPMDAPTPSRMTELGKRVLSTVVLLPIFIWIVVGGPGWLFTVMIVGVGMLANWEFTRMFQRAGVPVLREAGLLWGGLVTLAFVRPDGRFGFFEGDLSGRLLEAPRGEGGFGYDPLLYLPPEGRTVAELDVETKNRISHRGKALAAFRAWLAGELAGPHAAGTRREAQRRAE